MTLFVVVSRNKRNGKEYIADKRPEGYEELSHARADTDEVQESDGDDYEVYVGRVVNVDRKHGGGLFDEPEKLL